VGLIKALRKESAKAPHWFRDAALLRHALPLILDHGTVRYDAVVARLDRRLGLVIAKEREE